MFYGVGAGGTVKNLNVAGSISSTNMYAGYFGGVAVINAGTITNCYSAMDITSAGNFAGGIAGINEEDATISYCAASGNITWTGGSDYYAYVAGITGENYYGYVNNCAMLGDVLAQNAKDQYNYAGRLIGRQFNASSSHDCYYLDTMTVTGAVYSDSVTAKTADELKEIGQAAYDAGYTVYGLALGAVAPNPDQEAADPVIALIDAIGEVVLTDECKQKIDAARNAYDALTDAQKTFVDNYETLAIAEGQYAALQLAADMTAFEAYKTAKKSAMDALLQEGDSEAVQSIVGLAKTQIEGFTYDESKTLDENKAALDTLVANVPNAVAEQRAADAQLAADKAAFEAYKAEKKAAVEAMAEEGDSTDAQQIITDAAAAIDALTYDEAKTLDENKAAVDAAADIADRLAAQRATDLYAAKIEFDHYKTEQKAAVEAMAQEGDSEAVAQIIAEAAAAIDALIYDEFYTLAENKATVDTLANIADRLAAQRAADAAAAQLAADKAAFDAYKFNLVAAVQAMAQDGDSEAAAQIIDDAAAAIALLDYDTAKTLDENKAAVDALANIADRLAAQRAADAAAQLAADKAAFEAYKAEKKAAVEAMAEEGDSEAAQKIIADAAAAIDALTYDEAKTLDENKAAVDALADIADALAAQRAADKLAADKAAFDAYKFNLVAAVQAMAQDGDSEAAAQIVADAAAAIDALVYDEAKTLDENKAAADAAADIADALTAQRAADAASETPVEPTAPAEKSECPICGKIHDGNIVDNFIGLFHAMIIMFRNIVVNLSLVG